MKRFSRITTTQLARICGVSQGTVDRALNNRGEISPKTKERILRVAREYDFHPRVSAAQQTNSMLIGVVLFDLKNEFFSKLAMDFVSAAKSRGYSVLFQFSEKSLKNERTAIEYFDYIGVDGIALFSVGSDNEEYVEYLRSLKRPLALIGNKIADLAYIGIDDRAAMYELSLKICEKTSGEVVYYAPALRYTLHRDNAQRLRLSGFTDAMYKSERPYRILDNIDDIGNFGAIICGTDYYALEVLSRLSYPTDITVAGFDNLDSLKMLRTPFVTVDSATAIVAEECINYILGSAYSSEIPYRIVSN